jgi:hypothetical protein
MIKFGATYGLLPDPYGMLAKQLNTYLSSELRCITAPRPSSAVQRGSNIVYLNYPELPRPEINRLVIPTGATRWSYMCMLVTGTQKEALYTEAAGGPLTLQYRTEKRSEVGARRTIKMKMWPLQALPISPEIVNSNREHVTFDPRFGEAASVAAGLDTSSRPESLYLIPLVDGRYWWQYKDVGQISEQDITTPTELVNYLIGRSGSGISTLIIHPEYDKVPAVLDNDGENLAVVLDSAAWQLGLTVCPNMEEDGATFVLLDGERSGIIHSDNMAGQNRVIAEEAEDIGYPVGVMGDELDPGLITSAAFLPESVLIPVNGRDTFAVSAVSAGFSRRVIYGARQILRYRWVGDNAVDTTETLATRIAKDFYARYLFQYDRTFVGSQQWQPCSFTDVIVHEMNGLTRIRSTPPNLIPEVPGFNIEKRYQGILEEDLFAPPDWTKSNKTALVSLWKKNALGEMYDTEIDFLIINRFENIEIEAGTIVKFEFIDGEWQLYAVDCPASGSSSSSAVGSVGTA